jgi:hypothetical protein
MKETILDDATLDNTKLYYTELQGASLKKTRLRFADLERAKMDCIFMEDIKLDNTNLTNIILEKANANLSGVNLYFARYHDLILDGITCDYFYYDKKKEIRIPEDRNFKPGEFEEFMNKLRDIPKRLQTQINKKNLVFISHVKEDEDKIKQLYDDLIKDKINIFIDWRDIRKGDSLSTTISQAINASTHFIACFSNNYYNRPNNYMNNELSIAVDRLKKMDNRERWFIPILLDRCEIPPFNLNGNETLRNILGINLYDNWQEGIRELIETLNEY